ncbi:MAG: hypothetical protein WAT58_08560, partial [Candidatus Dormiibacterota bacterium]
MRAILEPLAWRRLWRYEESLRGRVWRDRGFADRKPSITLIEQLRQRDQPRDGARLSPTTSRVGLIGQAAPGQGTSSNLVARFYGLAVEGASGVEAADIWARATREAWPLVIADARDRPPHASG